MPRAALRRLAGEIGTSPCLCWTTRQRTSTSTSGFQLGVRGLRIGAAKRQEAGKTQLPALHLVDGLPLNGGAEVALRHGMLCIGVHQFIIYYLLPWQVWNDDTHNSSEIRP